MTKAKQPKQSAGYKGNNNLKQIGEQINFTLHQVQEYNKCKNDPIYFLENYGKIIALGKGIVPFKLFPYQRRIINAVTKNRKVVGKLGRQQGKCVSGDTNITIRNKTTGEIIVITIEDFYNLIALQQGEENDSV